MDSRPSSGLLSVYLMPVSKGKKGVSQELHKYKQGKLHSGSKSGPVVKSRKQAIAIAMHEAGMGGKKKKR